MLANSLLITVDICIDHIGSVFMPIMVQLAPSIYSRGCRPDMMKPCCSAGMLFVLRHPCYSQEYNSVFSPAEVLSAELLLHLNDVMPWLAGAVLHSHPYS